MILHLNVNAELLSKFNAIADGLAENGFSVTDDFLSEVEVSAITSLEDFKNGLRNFKKAGIGQQHDKQINESIRGDYIRWLTKAEAPPSLQLYLERIDQLREFINQALFLSLKDAEIHQTIYPIGSFYKRHLDQFKKEDHRKLTIICYLNKNWKEEMGGQLRVYFQNETKDFFPLAGRLVCFRSDLLEHEVLPATHPRLSLTGWLLDTLH
ncbi:MAG: 2OG-Fe(II) oxygenase [Bacteroidetes bacterium]|nr:2OG-Fe(II) oxygenase [Bacteroidota bacterium]